MSPRGNETRTRSLRVPDFRWETARRNAEREGLNMTDLVNILLDDYNEGGGTLHRPAGRATPTRKARA